VCSTGRGTVVHVGAKATQFHRKRSVTIVTIVTVNLLNYDGKDTKKRKETAQLIGEQNPDVVAAQEFISSGPDNDHGDRTKREAAEFALCMLAEDLGMECMVGDRPALALSDTRHHTGLLWRKGIRASDLMCYDSAIYKVSHGMTVAVFTVDGKEFRVASVHSSPFDPGMPDGWKDAGQVHRALHRGDGIPGIACGDWQGIGSDKRYDRNPYKGVPWHPSHAYHYDPWGKVDRWGAVRMEKIFRFRDCARIVGVPWQPTTGHHDTDSQPPRRIDRAYVTYHFPTAAVRWFSVVDKVRVGQRLDHCPVVVGIDETHL
jgi:endonuclease/exonuclease/phosphatase family metal-dependent hydrolase